MLVPGTVPGGFAMKRSSVASVHTIFDRFIASEYANPGTLPARRPRTPGGRAP